MSLKFRPCSHLLQSFKLKISSNEKQNYFIVTSTSLVLLCLEILELSGHYKREFFLFVFSHPNFSSFLTIISGSSLNFKLREVKCFPWLLFPQPSRQTFIKITFNKSFPDEEVNHNETLSTEKSRNIELVMESRSFY